MNTPETAVPEATPLTLVRAADHAAPSMSLDRQMLLAEYRKLDATSPATQFGRARLEARIWESIPREERVGKLKRDVLRAIINDTALNDIEIRAALFMQGAATKPLWDAISSGEVKLRRAAEVLRHGRSIATETGTTLAHGVLKALAEYRAAPLAPNGIGKKAPKRRVLRGPTKGRIAIQNSHKPQRSNTPLAEAGRFWSSIREQVIEFMRSRAGDADEIVIERLVSEFMQDLKVVTGQLSTKLRRLSDADTVSNVLKRASVIAACRELSMDPPPPGRPVNLTVAKTRSRSLARAYHPDVGGNENTTEQYQAVLDAYSTLEMYNEQVGKK